MPTLRAVADALRAGQEPDARHHVALVRLCRGASKCGTTRPRDVILERMARASAPQGALLPLRLTLLALGATLIAAGRLADAEACYDEAVELTLAVGQDPARVQTA